MSEFGQVYLVGAGCGDADLITLRGLRIIQRCDAIVYDDLIDTTLLLSAPKTAELYYVGKRSGKHYAPQSDINKLLVDLAMQGKNVVRLKGGDPFVFGRGGEEILALQAANIPYDEVPGISSAIAIPAAAGIPVSHRELSRSIHIITGHTAGTQNTLPENFSEFAKLDGTLIFLMGLSQLSLIVDNLIQQGKSPYVPVAVLSGGNSAHPCTVRGTLSTIVERTKSANVVSPAVIVIGEVAKLDFSPTIPRPLSNVTIGLTGTHAVTAPLMQQLCVLGAKCIVVQTSHVMPIPFNYDFSKLGHGSYWLVFTSTNGVHSFFREYFSSGYDIRALYCCKFAVIGSATGKTLSSYGICYDLCPEKYTSQSLGEALCNSVQKDEQVLLFRSAHGSQKLNELLASSHIPYQDIPTYSLEPDTRIASESSFDLNSLDYLIFSSSSGVDFFFNRYGNLSEKTKCVCIGQITEAALKKHISRPPITASEAKTSSIVHSILNSCQNE